MSNKPRRYPLPTAHYPLPTLPRACTAHALTLVCWLCDGWAGAARSEQSLQVEREQRSREREEGGREAGRLRKGESSQCHPPQFHFFTHRLPTLALPRPAPFHTAEHAATHPWPSSRGASH